MSEPTRDPIHDLENFGTGGHVMAPLAPNEVRRLGDRRRTHRRTAAVVAASVVAVLAVGIPLALTRGGDTNGSRDIANTPSSTPASSSAPTPTAIVTYPGAGIVVKTAADVDELTGTPADFRSFIADQLTRIPGSAQCAEIQVQKYSPAGYALGGVGSCGGYIALWVLHQGGDLEKPPTWQEGYATQDTWDCPTLKYFGVPRAFVGDCISYAGDFGPDEVEGLRLGMTPVEIEAAGAEIGLGPADACRNVALPSQKGEDGLGSGVLSPTKGLVGIFAHPGMKTPEKIGLGSTLADFRAAYPGATHGFSWSVPLADGARYVIQVDKSRMIYELDLEMDVQDCFG